MGVLFTPLAETDLEDIGDYIAQDNPARALTFIQDIRGQCQKVGKSPLAYRARTELGDGIRSCPFGNYVILYRPDAPDVLIVRVLHGAMDLPRHMDSEDTRALVVCTRHTRESVLACFDVIAGNACG